MVMYKKRSSPARPYSKRRPYKKNTSTFVKKVKAVINKVAETKTSIIAGTEVVTSTLTSPTSSHVIPLNSILTASGQSNRTGVKISPRFLNVRGAVHMSPSTSTLQARVLILQHDSSEDPISTLLENNSGTFSAAGSDFTAIYARLNTTKYRILGSKVVRLGSQNGYYNTGMFNFNIKLSGNMYYEVGASIPSKRQLTLMWFARRTDNDESLGTDCEISYNSKFYYQDM